MSTRSRRKPAGTAPVPDPEPVPTATVVKPTRAKANVPAAKKKKVIMTPIKKRVPPQKKPTRGPKLGTTVVSEGESDSSQLLKDPELYESEDDSQLKIEQLRKQLAELEAKQESRRQLKLKQSQSSDGSHREPKSMNKGADSTEGRNLGTFNGRTDLDILISI